MWAQGKGNLRPVGEGSLALRIPTPRDGWRIFIGEVGVIVLGVLIALGAQEAVTAYNMRNDVRTFEDTVRKEIGNNLYSYQFRAEQFDCIDRNVKEMLAWLEEARSTERPKPIAQFAFPNTIIFYRSAWDNKDPNIFANLPRERKLRYSEFYDELGNNDRLAWKEIDAWVAMYGFSEDGPVSAQERRQAAVALLQIRGYNHLFRSNFEQSKAIARDLGIAPVKPDNVDDDAMTRLKQCNGLKALGAS